MKRTVTQSVMWKIIRYEKSHMRQWLAVFLSIVALCIGIMLVSLWFLYRQSTALGTWSMLAIFGEDREIIAEYWKEVLQTMVTELPMEYIAGLMISLVFLGILLLGTKKNRHRMKQKMKEIRLYTKKGVI